MLWNTGIDMRNDSYVLRTNESPTIKRGRRETMRCICLASKGGNSQSSGTHICFSGCDVLRRQRYSPSTFKSLYNGGFADFCHVPLVTSHCVFPSTSNFKGLGVGAGLEDGVGADVGFGVGLGVGAGLGDGVGADVGLGVGLGVALTKATAADVAAFCTVNTWKLSQPIHQSLNTPLYNTQDVVAIHSAWQFPMEASELLKSNTRLDPGSHA